MKNDNTVLFFPFHCSDVPKEAEQDQESESISTCTKDVTEQDSLTAQSPTHSAVLEADLKGLTEEKKTEDKEEEEHNPESEDWAVFKADGVEFQINLKERLERERPDNRAEQDEKDDDDDVERYFIGELRLSLAFLNSFVKYVIIQDVVVSGRSFSGQQRALVASFLYNSTTMTLTEYKQDNVCILSHMHYEPANTYDEMCDQLPDGTLLTGY